MQPQVGTPSRVVAAWVNLLNLCAPTYIWQYLEEGKPWQYSDFPAISEQHVLEKHDQNLLQTSCVHMHSTGTGVQRCNIFLPGALTWQGIPCASTGLAAQASMLAPQDVFQALTSSNNDLRPPRACYAMVSQCTMLVWLNVARTGPNAEAVRLLQDIMVLCTSCHHSNAPR